MIQLKSIVSCSSEDRINCAKNLLDNDEEKKWLAAGGDEERINCVLEFDQPSSIGSIEIGNCGSAFIELLVSKGNDWKILLPATPLMTPTESRSNINRNQMKTFKSSDFESAALNDKWKRLKILCEQKFNRSKQFGLSFIRVYSESKEIAVTIDEIDEEPTKIGDFFAKKRAEKSSTTSSISVAEEFLRRKSSTIKSSTSSNDDKSKLMKNVVFVLSGFQNPLRSELRNKAAAMGATSCDDWDDKCTHLICAFPNTPKYFQVQQNGKGSIVDQNWIIDCFDQNRLLPEKNYQFKNESGEKRKTINEKTPVKKKSMKKDPTEEKQGDLPNFFHGIHFYVSYGDFDDKTLLDIVRVILAYDGTLERQINSNVKYVITKRMWNHDFEKISKTNPEINFISIDWLQDCHDQNGFAPVQSHLIVP